MPFFSVIVPAYNSEKYIRKGLDSIKAQTFTDYELIIVCDSCTDGTEKIAYEYTNKVYKSTYGSAGGSRNIGLDHSRGKWILFMDDDDWWETNQAFELLKERCENTAHDIVAFSFIIGENEYATCKKDWIAVWNKAWRGSYINNGEHRFPTTLFWDDVKFSEGTKDATVILFNKALYHYNFPREGCVTMRKNRGEFGTRVQDEYKLLYGKEI